MMSPQSGTLPAAQLACLLGGSEMYPWALADVAGRTTTSTGASRTPAAAAKSFLFQVISAPRGGTALFRREGERSHRGRCGLDHKSNRAQRSTRNRRTAVELTRSAQ